MVKAFMKWYGEPLTDVHIKIPKALPAYTEDIDIQKLLAAAGYKKSHKKLITRDKLLIELALKTGLRRAELANLIPVDVHENALIERQGKGKKDRMIPLTEDLANNLKELTKNHKPDQKVFGLGARVEKLPSGEMTIFISLNGTTIVISQKSQPPFGHDHFGIATDDIEATVKDLKAAGYKITVEITAINSKTKFADFLGPDNVLVGLVQE